MAKRGKVVGRERKAGRRSGYWWQCDKCGHSCAFPDVTQSNSCAAFIWDELMPLGWDQAMLVLPCPACKRCALRITYASLREKEVQVRLLHAVGITPRPPDNYVPMMWETAPVGGDEVTCFDFKYIRERQAFGLGRPAVFDLDGLREVCALYREKTGNALRL